MKFKEIINELREFLIQRDWLNFPAHAVFIHLIEELGEVGKHILFDIEYKTESMGHKKPNKHDLQRELAQSFTLLLQLSLILDVDLEKAWMEELKIMKDRFPREKLNNVRKERDLDVSDNEEKTK
ncbi:MAG: hypothetical protein K9W45_05750 [Candidatus Heimdallarchaeum aukensis]|uniref:NTP pyrophosphohydrolase MazG putative catalytic core domain-containing protein n=1 Tax=Candidatus Heimdallarchaeum aukensis TaxID=2876573 RepID=A0A9Y1FMU2_9ARCH|nr:MAG: hypothetical protein K9W45_05750 [Candidatus Heimdallarchaeum aukensis]